MIRDLCQQIGWEDDLNKICSSLKDNKQVSDLTTQIDSMQINSKEEEKVEVDDEDIDFFDGDVAFPPKLH